MEMSDLSLWKLGVSLGVPGFALAVFYMLFQKFNWKIPAVSKSWAGPLMLVFLLLTASLIFSALYLWAPQNTPIQPKTDTTNNTATNDVQPINENPVQDIWINGVDQLSDLILGSQK